MMELEERRHGSSSTTGHEEGRETWQERATALHTGRRQAEIDSDYINKITHWWSHNVSLVLDHDTHGPSRGDPRDYLALERTYLGWFRTSVAVGSFGVVVAQLFILKALDPGKGKILGALLSGGAIVTSLLGCTRYFRQQRLLTQHKTLAGGWHVTIFLVVLFTAFMTLFVIVILES